VSGLLAGWSEEAGSLEWEFSANCWAVFSAFSMASCIILGFISLNELILDIFVNKFFFRIFAPKLPKH